MKNAACAVLSKNIIVTLTAGTRSTMSGLGSDEGNSNRNCNHVRANIRQQQDIRLSNQYNDHSVPHIPLELQNNMIGLVNKGKERKKILIHYKLKVHIKPKLYCLFGCSKVF